MNWRCTDDNERRMTATNDNGPKISPRRPHYGGHTMLFSRPYEQSRLCCNVTSVWRLSVVCNVCISAKRYFLELKLL